MRAVICGCLLAALVVWLPTAVQADRESALKAFEELKQLEGTWLGNAHGPEAPPVVVSYHITARGNAVIETNSPGTAGEMTTVFAVEGDDLIATHYCAGGTVTRMKMDVAKTKAMNTAADTKGKDNVAFGFVDVRNLNQRSDGLFMHSGSMTIDNPGNTVKTHWVTFQGKKTLGADPVELIRQCD